MKLKILILMITLFSLVSAETFMEEIIGICQPLCILAIFFAPPVLIVLIIMAVCGVFKTGANLTTDLLNDDEE